MSGRMPARLALLFSFLLVVMVGCRRDEVHSYRVPKEDAPTMAQIAAEATATEAVLTWDAPDHWVDQGASNMRRGSFSVPGPDGTSADLSIIAFPGDVGGMTANVNRWRDQVGLPPLSETDVQASLEHLDTLHLHMDLVSMSGETGGVPTRIDGAIFSRGNETWFIKFMGPADIVAAEEQNFRLFINTVAPAQN